jgi:hypothetical protein
MIGVRRMMASECDGRRNALQYGPALPADRRAARNFLENAKNNAVFQRLVPIKGLRR